ncbi:MAG: site-specific integrase [Candidatus Micrarchaeaceae archaeon]
MDTADINAKNIDPINELRKGRRIVYAPSQQAIFDKGMELKDKELRALYYFLYLSGARISEALALRYGDVEYPVSIEGHRYAKVRLITLKNKRRGLRFLPIPLYIPLEASMFELFKSVYEHRIDKVFKDVGSRNNVWNKLHSKISFDCDVLDMKTKKVSKENVALHPHLLRHFRLTHLVTIYNYNAFQLQDFAGWARQDMAVIYVSLGITSLTEPFSKSNYRNM